MKETFIYQRFEERAGASPERIALEFAGRSMTYGEVNRCANRLAWFLRSRGVGKEAVVGIYYQRGMEMVIGLLAIMKAGGAYLPIDPAYPPERVTFILDDAGIPILLTQSALKSAVCGTGAELVCTDDPDHAAMIDRLPDGNLRPEGDLDSLAYVIYTSGSTGRPKGSLITHRNLSRLFDSTENWFGFGPEDVWTLFHSIAFDFSVWEIWGAWSYGGKLVIVPFEVSRTPALFHRLLSDAKVTVLNQTPSAFRQLIRADESDESKGCGLALRLVIFGGEALDMKWLQPWFDRHGDECPQLVNMYGITETTVHVTYRRIRLKDVSRTSLIGIPIPDLTLHLLDDDLHPVARGEVGEICVGGPGVCRGYLKRPDLTREKFIQWGQGSRPSERLYRSGDLGRVLDDGELEYLGRKDFQVKIRGFRIELGEIETVLSGHCSVRECLVVARRPEGGEPCLVAYVIPLPGKVQDRGGLRSLARQKLPDYMVPADIIYIDQLPLTTNGKLDVGALPAPFQEEDGTGPGSSNLSANPTEQVLAAIWGEVIGRPVTGLDDSFFDIGGNSIHLAQVHVRINAAFKREIAITDLFAFHTIRALALRLDGNEISRAVRAPEASRAEKQREAMAAQKRRQSPRREGDLNK